MSFNGRLQLILCGHRSVTSSFSAVVKNTPGNEQKMNINAVRRSVLSLIALFIAQTMPMALAEDDAAPGGPLTGKIDYSYVGHLGQKDDAGRSLVWEGTVEGDLNGKMKWWFVNPPPAPKITYMGGRLTFYAARWEIRAGEELLLAGESGGKTDFRDGVDGIWDGHGLVTEASEKFQSLRGRRIYETGSVILGSDPPVSLSGAGIFLIY